ncbi:SDR family oxidoreductase [Cnuibacter sp. UC19_7]|uniref:SDR family oxidoreductase n=1 Tax=Cnuibacter sp. UC19_7 TaxID=3350166 RepID=UPI00366E3863
MRIAIAGATGTVGRHVLAAARRRGHETVPLSRASGQDVTTGEGLAAALAGADALIDVTSVETLSAKVAVDFFERATERMLAAEQAAGVPHHVALSIVGIDGVDASYYSGKLAQERSVAAGGVPWTVLRAAQFHEFAGQVMRRGSVGPLVAVPRALVRTVAAREVGERLVELAEGGPLGRARDLVGPEDARLIDLVRRRLRADGIRRPAFEVALPGLYWRSMASGALRGGAEAQRGAITFDEWLRSPNHTAP